MPTLQKLSFQEYQRVKGVNNSILQQLARSPAHAYYYVTHPEGDTPALQFGRAVHSAILEPDEFEHLYVSVPDFGDLRTTAAKAQRAEWQLANADKAHLKRDDFDSCLALRDAAWAKPEAAALLSGPGMNERSVVWEDVGTNLTCKSRIDRVTMYEKWTTVVEVKTARTASPWGFAQAAAQYGYHRQAAFYLRGLNAIEDRERRFMFIVLEKEPPYCCEVYELENPVLMAGEEQVQALLYRYAECLKRNEWPGYVNGIHPLRMPEWALNRRFEDE